MHFSTFFTYMEEAEHDFLRHLGLSVVMEVDGLTLSWPRVSTKCDFTGVLQFETTFDVEVRVARIGEKSVTYAFRFFRGDEVVAHGQVVAVCCHVVPGQRPVSVPIPVEFVEALTPYLIED